jgi:hypothetical protein
VHLGGTGAFAICTADLNVDGVLDIVSANSRGGTITAVLGVGGGRFAASELLMEATAAWRVGVADFNEDGRPDLVVGRNASDVTTLRVLLNYANPGGTTCGTPDPFVILGGGTCYNGDWLPPGMLLWGLSPFAMFPSFP